jgi:outer membrane protein assembly factor BamB
VLENGHILFYNNNIDPSRYAPGPSEFSQIIELDPVSGKVVWSFSPKSPNDFYNWQYGGVYPLPNGDLVVTDAHHGRVFEVSRQKKLRWEWFHPERDNEGKAITIFFAKKFPAELIEPFLEDK